MTPAGGAGHGTAPSSRPARSSAAAIPTRLEHVTPEWLTAFLGTRHPGVQVEALEVLDHTQGAATRMRIRVQYAEGARAGLP